MLLFSRRRYYLFCYSTDKKFKLKTNNEIVKCSRGSRFRSFLLLVLFDLNKYLHIWERRSIVDRYSTKANIMSRKKKKNYKKFFERLARATQLLDLLWKIIEHFI